MRILAVYGATQKEGLSHAMVHLITEAAEQAGGEITHLNLLAKELPTFRVDRSFSQNPLVQEVRELTAASDAFVLVTPEYHGSMSNWMKNYFDFHWKEFGGKLFALAASTGGSQGSNALNNLRTAVQHCHGWALPYHTGVSERDFDNETKQFLNPRSYDRLARMGRDLVTYGKVLRTQFTKEQHMEQSEVGFAGWYAIQEAQA